MNVEQLFLRRIDRIGRICTEHRICSHDRAHHQRVFRNAQILNTCLPFPLPEDELQNQVLAHDIGYGCTGIVWEGKHAINHAARGKTVLRRAASIFLPQEEDRKSVV